MRKQSTGEALTWGYSKENGPDTWHTSYPLAKGNNQSPVAILSKDAFKDPALLPWFTGYDPGAAKNIRNTGKTLRITFDDTFDRSDSFGTLEFLL
ncbi:PREDICTED: carbonic anhydrase 3-like [Thamnophis sirtalis]|uniref:Carbonic anhydrase 3-like n=1 Tax=Thamnophis sirtalis TaxID=35019 RepID=A0A6I9XBM6_9SAUR|nr:PREDICTED: carbonic anhydrase 3-like [Thamnophis sirtalis]